MKRSILAPVVASLLLAACDKIPLPSAARVGASQVAVLDMAAVAKALGRDEVVKQQLEAAGRQLQQQLSDVTSDLQEKLRDEQSRLGETPSEEEQQQLQRMTRDAQRQLQQTQALARQKAVQLQNQLVSQFRAEVQPVAARVAARHGATTVMMANTLLWFAPTVDITGEVIDALRARSPATAPAPADAAPSGDTAPATGTQ